MAAEDAEECRQPSAINLSTPRRTPERSEHSDNNVSTDRHSAERLLNPGNISAM